MTSPGGLVDGTEESLRSALAVVAPELAALPVTVNARPPSSNPLWWSSSAVVDRRFAVKFAWSDIRARRLWREGVILERLGRSTPRLPVPELVTLSCDPTLVITRLVPGEPLTAEWVRSLPGTGSAEVATELAAFMGRLHGLEVTDVLGDLEVVEPTPQAETGGLRARYPRLVDLRRGNLVVRWCDWVDGVLDAVPSPFPGVIVHGDLHGYNQVWDRASSTLLAVVDFEQSGIADPHFDLRYLPSFSHELGLTLGVMDAYERTSGRHLVIERVMAWHVLTALGDALWRTEAGVTLSGGGNAGTYVDDLAIHLDSLGLN